MIANKVIPRNFLAIMSLESLTWDKHMVDVINTNVQLLRKMLPISGNQLLCLIDQKEKKYLNKPII